MNVAAIGGVDVSGLLATQPDLKNAATVAQELEATFFRLLLQASGLLQAADVSGGAGVWHELLTQQLAQELASQHRLGVGQLVLQALNEEGGQ